MPLTGTWKVVCFRDNTVDEVSGYTGAHDCSQCGQDVFVDGSVAVKCINQDNGAICGQIDKVSGLTTSHNCSRCGREMRIGFP